MIRGATPLLLCALCATATAETYAEEIEAGRRHFEANRLDEALTHFARARALGPNDWRGHAFQVFTLIEQARGTHERQRRGALLREAEQVSGVLIKNGIVLFQDPLYKFMRGLHFDLIGDDPKAHEYLRQAYRAPPARFRRYAEIDLRGLVERAFATVTARLATRIIMFGDFSRADVMLREVAPLLPDDDPGRIALERQSAAVSEHFNRNEEAIGHLRRCIALSKDDPKAVQEFTGAIAMILFKTEKFEEGAKVLGELPPDCNHPEVIVARAASLYKQALRAPESDAMDDALGFHRRAIDDAPADDRHRLVVPYVELILEKVGPRDADKERALLDSAVRLAKIEIDRRPECPSLYFFLHRIYKLLGKENLAIHYQDLHARKKDEYDRKEHCDELGRPLCR
jgi:tetratricopeptide (TPR) repeat protein